MSTRRLAVSVPEPATRCPPRCPVEAPSVSPQGYGSSLLPGPPTSVLAAPPPAVRSMVKVWGSCGNVTSLLRTLRLPQNGEVRAAEATARPQSPAQGARDPSAARPCALCSVCSSRVDSLAVPTSERQQPPLHLSRMPLPGQGFRWHSGLSHGVVAGEGLSRMCRVSSSTPGLLARRRWHPLPA